MKILESRLSLNVTILASQPDDHLTDGEPMKYGMVAPASLTLLPCRAQVEWFLGLGKDDFIGVPHSNKWRGDVLDGLGHEALPLCQSYHNKTLRHQQQHSPTTHGGQGNE